MNPPPPQSIIVLGLLHLVVGTIGVLWDGTGLVSLTSGEHLAGRYFTPKEQAAMAQREAAMENRVPYLRAYQVVVAQVIPWLLTAALLAGGVGLLRLRPWARTLSLGYAVASILHKIGQAVYTLAFLMPFYKTPIYVLEMTKPELTPGAETISNLAAIITPLVLMAYPVLVLVIMSRPAVALALAPKKDPIGYTASG
jgi:hypothetical protein